MQYRVTFDSIEREIARIAVSGSSPQTMLSNIAAKVGEFFQAEACGVLTDQLNSFDRRVIGWWHEDSFVVENQERLLQKLSQSLFSKETKAKLDANTEKYSHLEPLKGLVREILPTKVCLGTLTKVCHESNGAILLLKSPSLPWSDSQRQLLDRISDSIALVISQIQLRQQAQTKTKFQSVLNRLSREISQNSAPEVLFDTCLSEVSNALQVSQASILQLKYQNPLRTHRARQKVVSGTVRITCQWSAEGKTQVDEGQPGFNLQDSQLCQEALKLAPQPLIISELTPFPDLPLQQLSQDSSSLSALLMMPLMGRSTSDSESGLVLGFLVLQQDAPRLWSDDELDLIDWISVQITTATIHHQTLSRVQSIVDDRTSQLTHALEFQAKLTEKMRQQIEQLQQLNQLKDDFLNSMSHELKTPLTSMKMAIKMLRQEQLPRSIQEKYLSILEQEWNREYNLIKDLLTLQQVESGEFAVSLQELDLLRLIEPLARSFIDKWQPVKGLSLKTNFADSAVNLYTDAESLQYILEELFTNAGKYSAADTTVEVSAEGDGKRGGTVAIAVSSYGAAIASEELPYVFDKFRRGKGVTDRAVQGTGLGLALVKYLIEHLNGSIEVTSEPVAKSPLFVTTFTIKLPRS